MYPFEICKKSGMLCITVDIYLVNQHPNLLLVDVLAQDVHHFAQLFNADSFVVVRVKETEGLFQLYKKQVIGSVH